MASKTSGHQRKFSSGQIPSMNIAGNELKSNTLVVVLGASGDLAKKKTFPALFGLYKQGYLPGDVHIVGYARTKMEADQFHKHETQYIKVPEGDSETPKTIQAFQGISSYVSGAYDDDAAFQNLEKHLQEIESNYKTKERNRIFYFALPPSVFISVAQKLKKNNYVEGGSMRVIVEKPFGKDLDSCLEMLKAVGKEWKEEETYRIDHYLGKEMVKNLLVLRFANIALSAGWNNNSISNVQITFKEPFGTEGRGGYFDEFGIIRDIQQNHLLQVLTVLAMDRPVSFSAKDIRDEKVKLLRFIPPIKKEDVLLGQYVRSGDKPGYLEDKTVPEGSQCPTYAACTLYINNPRWEGVPFILKAGKALNEGKVEIRIQYKDVTRGIFEGIGRDELVIRLQPKESVYMKMNVKEPGLHTQTMMTEMDLTYERRFADMHIPEAYEALILDAFKGDHSNFVRADELEAGWKIFTPILHWIDSKDAAAKPKPYPYGTRGPAELNDFIAKYNFQRIETPYQWPITHVEQLAAQAAQ